MNENVVKSSDLPKPSNADEPVKQSPAKKVPAKKKAAAKKPPVAEKKIAKPSPGKKFIFFATGTSYRTKSGLRFDWSKRIYEVDEEEADHLLSLDNFRLPTQIELEEYLKGEH